MDEPESIANLSDQYVVAVARATRQILDEGRTVEKLEELAMVAGRYADGEIEAWRGRPDSPEGVACRVGCSYCCHVPVGVAIPEAILIGNTLLAESTDEELAEVLEKVRRAEHARFGLVGQERDQVRHPCPMLDEPEGACSIYEYRPLNCRGWNSLDVSPCKSFFDDPNGGLPILIDGVQRTISQSIATGMQEGLATRSLEHSTVDLAIALRIVLEDPTAIDRWLAGAPAFRDAEVADEGYRG
jgi:hypothetical protein